MRIQLLIPLILAAAAAPAEAQPAEAQPADPLDGPICVGGPRWEPTHAETAAIASDPVPASFRRLFEAVGTCSRMASNEDVLVDWHLNFGDEPSLTNALAYIRADYTRGTPAPDRYIPDLTQAWRSAEPDVRRAMEVFEPQGEQRPAAFRIVAESEPAQRFEQLQEIRSRYLYLAQQYLRGAQEHRSQALLAQAELYLQPVVASRELLSRLEAAQPHDELGVFDTDNFATYDFEAKGAVLRAGLSGSADAFARAAAVLLREQHPAHKAIVRLAYSDGSEFCDITPSDIDSDEVEAACEADRELGERAVNLQVSQALLALQSRRADQKGWDSDYEIALRLLEAERAVSDESRCCLRCCVNIGVEDALHLRLAAAEHFLVPHVRSGDRSPRPDFYRAMEALQAATSLTPPYDAPARFRRVGEAWLHVYRQRREAWLREEDRSTRYVYPADERYAAYLTRTLAQLDLIAQGGE